MRNLKKILALALALAMVMSMTAFAGFTDAAKIDDSYAEAVEVLTGMKVIKGYEDGSFKPQGTITRAEVAAIIYRIATQDVKDAKAGLYAGLANFSDVKAADWFAGYVGYCANAGYIKGYPDGTFKPQGLVTGFEALAMVLRALGYDAENEFTGITWTDKVAKAGYQAGILEELNADEKLAAPAERELVAQMAFTALNDATIVRYTPAFGYTKTATTLGDAFELVEIETEDAWFRPGYGYTYNTGDKKTVFAKKPIASYVEAVTECEVAEVADFSGVKTYNLFVNGYKTTDTLQAIDTVDTIGAQGRLTEVYKDRIVMIDTFLAKVISVADATFDARGHLKTPSKIVLEVYDGEKASTYTETNKDENYTYDAGDYVLVNAYTKTGNRDNAGKISGEYAEILGLAEYEVGTQSVIWYNAGKHTINNVTYNDAAELNLDEAGFKTTTYTWFFDLYGNVIGDVEVATEYDYAVLKNIWWAGDNTTGKGVAKATLIYMDGSENVVTLDSINGCTPKYSTIWSDVMVFDKAAEVVKVATDLGTNATRDNAHDDAILGHLFRVTTYSDGTIGLDVVENELQNATIINKFAFIENVKIDLDTQFLVRGALESSSFKTYTGLNELPSFKATNKVDYVLGADGVAEYVYIIGSTVDASDSEFILIVDNAYSAVLKSTGNVKYWELTLPVPAEDGSVVTLKTTDYKVVEALTSIDNVGKLFYVTYTNDYAVKVEPVTTAIFQYSTNGRAIQLNKTATYKSGVIESGSYRFNVTSATVVIGDFAADMTDKVVYVIYDGRDVNASKVYVLDINDVINPEVIPSDWTVEADGYSYNKVAKKVAAPAGATLNDLAAKYTGTVTAVYYTTDANGIVNKVEMKNGNATIDSLLTIGAQITLVNANGTWSVID